MLTKISLRLAIIFINIVSSLCYVNYVIFKGFDAAEDHNNKTEKYPQWAHSHENNTKLGETHAMLSDALNATMSTAKKPSVKLKNFTKSCPETEDPISLGTYLIPTERDLVLFTKRNLQKMFSSYHERALLLLKDMKEITSASKEFERRCTGRSRSVYQHCVKRISKKSTSIIKWLVSSMEMQKQAVSSLMEETACTMTELATDPFVIIKELAIDGASLEFALPVFLRLIGGCSNYCSKEHVPQQIRVPLRHMTDQDLVIKHLLTNKNYIQLIKDPEGHV